MIISKVLHTKHIKIIFSIQFLCFSYIVLAQEDIQIELTEREKELIDHVQSCINFGEQKSSKLSRDVLKVPGMTSPKVKHFLNNLCTLTNCTYLEIGVWKGATFTAALYHNQDSIIQAVGIDNWSEFGGPYQEFKKYTSLYLKNIPFQFYSHDAFTINIGELFKNPVDIYFYDGNHTAQSQELAFTYYDSIFADAFIAIVDDWNHPPVPIGTRNAFEKLGYTILFERILPARPQGEDINQWWNGLYVAVIRR